MAVRADVGYGGGDGLEEKMAVAVNDVVTIFPHMSITNQCFGVASSERMRGVRCCLIVGLNSFGRSGEEWRCFDECDVLGRKVLSELTNDVSL